MMADSRVSPSAPPKEHDPLVPSPSLAKKNFGDHRVITVSEGTGDTSTEAVNSVADRSFSCNQNIMVPCCGIAGCVGVIYTVWTALALTGDQSDSSTVPTLIAMSILAVCGCGIACWGHFDPACYLKV